MSNYYRSSTAYKKVEVKCIYSGQKYTYYDTQREDKDKLRDKFMRDKCTCARCVEEREHRTKVIEALKRNNDTAGLKAMGVNV